MGVRISLSSLASAVANEGGIGTISSIGLGDVEASKLEYERMSHEALVAEIRKARGMTDGALAVNFMGVLSNVDDLIQAAVSEGIRIIVYGAGLPTKLPSLVPDPDISLVPIVSSARVANLIMRTWDKRSDRVPDALILEGPLAGGHLGFSPEQLENTEEHSLEILLPELLEVTKPFEDKHGQSIPIVVAGGIYTGSDIARMLQLGAAGVQMGTRFVVTDECDAAPEFKQEFLDANEEDIVIIQSPVGMPGRAINNRFLKALEKDRASGLKCSYRCLTACQIATARYCIADALVNSAAGDVNHGLIFCGANAHRVDRVIPVKELIEELLTELKAA
jgi:nitronate monooxygenase